MKSDKKAQVKLKALGLAIRKVRLAKSLTMREVGFRVERESSTIYRLETGKASADFVTLCDIAFALQIPLSQLILEYELQAEDHIITRK